MDQITGESVRTLRRDLLTSTTDEGRRRVVVIYNPKAGQRRYPLFSSVIKRLKAFGVEAAATAPSTKW